MFTVDRNCELAASRPVVPRNIEISVFPRRVCCSSRGSPVWPFVFLIYRSAETASTVELPMASGTPPAVGATTPPLPCDPWLSIDGLLSSPIIRRNFRHFLHYSSREAQKKYIYIYIYIYILTTLFGQVDRHSGQARQRGVCFKTK